MHLTLSAPTQWALAWAVAGMALALVVILAHRLARLVQTRALERAAVDAWLATKQRGAR